MELFLVVERLLPINDGSFLRAVLLSEHPTDASQTVGSKYSRQAAPKSSMSDRANNQTSGGQSSGDAGTLRQHAALAALVVNQNVRIISCAPEAEKLLQLKRGRGAPNRSVSLLPAALQELIREVRETGRAIADRQLCLGARKKTARTIHVSAMPVVSSTGKPQVVVLLNQLSVSRQLEENLARLDRLSGLGTLSAGMAHEIKNALVAVKTFTDLLLEKNRDAELADVVGREMRRIEALVGQMLKYASPARPAFSPVRLHDVLDHSLRMIKPRAERRLIALHRTFDASPDVIRGDDYQLEQAFVNVMLNAIDAMGMNGSLTVATSLVAEAQPQPKAASTSGAHVRVTIADTGIGIAEENLNRLFEPFFTTKQQGTGLGLTIARRIVQEHQGDISVQSLANQGTTFSIVLPVHAQAG